MKTNSLIEDKESKRSFLVGRILGDGTTAKCYKVTEVNSNKVYACKIVPLVYKETAEIEIAMLQDLSHVHIVRLDSWFSDDSNFYLILELCVHKSLIELLEKRRKLSETEVQVYLRQILLGCKYLHDRKIIHRDLKLNNIFLDEQLQVKIGDFGLATRSTNERGMMGTPNYLAPEIIKEEVHTLKVDIWAIGCVIFFLLTGDAPFETDSLNETYERIKTMKYNIPEDMSNDAKDIIKCLLQKRPAMRPTVEEILQMPFLTEGIQITSLSSECLKKAPRIFEVEKILESRIDRKGETEYLIRWKGYDESHDTWELASGCDCPTQVEEFNEKGNKAKTPKRKIPVEVDRRNKRLKQAAKLYPKLMKINQIEYAKFVE